MDDEVKGLLLRAMHEIRALRRDNEILGAKVRMIEFFETVLQTQPARPTEGVKMDVAWHIEKLIDAEERREKEGAGE